MSQSILNEALNLRGSKSAQAKAQLKDAHDKQRERILQLRAAL